MNKIPYDIPDPLDRLDARLDARETFFRKQGFTAVADDLAERLRAFRGLRASVDLLKADYEERGRWLSDEARWRKEAEAEVDRLKKILSDIHTFAHCTAKAGPLNTPDLQDAWSKFMQISAMATNGLAGTKPKQGSGWKS